MFTESYERLQNCELAISSFWTDISKECILVSPFRAITIPYSGNMQPVWSSMDAPVCRHVNVVSSALSFWQYQIHQESSYQQSVLKYANEKNAQLQKQLDNVIREGT